LKDESKRILSAKLNKEEDKILSHLTLNMQQVADDTRLNGQIYTSITYFAMHWSI